MCSIALTVCSNAPTTRLSPFFAKAGGLLLVEPDADSKEYVPNRDRTSDWVCDEILRRRAQRVISGFIGAPALRRLADAGVDVRLGPCSVPAECLIERFESLPKAVEIPVRRGYTRSGGVTPDPRRTLGPT